MKRRQSPADKCGAPSSSGGYDTTKILSQDTALPRGRAHAGPPCFGRTMWTIAVLACPICSGMHHHRAKDSSILLHGKAVRRCPATGLAYRLSPVRRWREARRG